MMIREAEKMVMAAMCGALMAGCGDSRQQPTAVEMPTVEDVSARELVAMTANPEAKAVMLHVWATWCPPCVAEFPDVVKLAGVYDDKGLEVLLVSVDAPDDLDAVKAFLAEHGVTRKTYRGENVNHAFIAAISDRWAGAIPATFIYNSDGELVEWWEGARDYNVHEQAVRKVLNP